MRLLRSGHHVRKDRCASGGQLSQRGDLQVAEDGHRHRARNRGGGHDQQVRPPVPRLIAQRIALLHAEPMLLVDHHQAEVGELHLLFEQRVGADHDPGLAR